MTDTNKQRAAQTVRRLKKNKAAKSD